MPRAPRENLHQLKPDVKWYSEDEDGAIQIKGCFYKDACGQLILSPAARVALALTEICCERRKGKVYVTAPHPTGHQNLARFEAYRASKAIPELFYTLEAWSAEDQKQWRAMSPKKRLQRLMSRHGCLDKTASVLPFALTLHEDHLARPELDAMQPALVTVLISLFAYVAYTEEMRSQCDGPYFTGRARGGPTDVMPVKCTYVSKTVGWQGFEQWRRAGGVGISDWFETHYREGSGDAPECLMFYGDLQRSLAEAGQLAVSAGQAYEMLGLASS